MALTVWSRHTGEMIELSALSIEDVGIGPDDPSFSLSPIYIEPKSTAEPEPPLPKVDPTPGAGWRDLVGE